MSFTTQPKGRTKTWMSNPNISQSDFKLGLEGKNHSQAREAVPEEQDKRKLKSRHIQTELA